jgi:Iap family predicted aminopeptidase
VKSVCHISFGRVVFVELIGGLDHEFARAGDQIMGLEQAVNLAQRDTNDWRSTKSHRQFAR